MKQQKEKPTAYEIAKIVIEAVVAASALIAAVRWW